MNSTPPEMDSVEDGQTVTTRSSKHPFRKAVLRGLAVLAPPLLTILIIVWVLNATFRYVFDPVTYCVRESIILVTGDIRENLEVSDPVRQTAEIDGQLYRKVGETGFVPLHVYNQVREDPGEPPPQTARSIYRRYVDLRWLRPYLTVPFFLSTFILVMYLLGKFMAAGVGRVFWGLFEQGIHRLPLIRNVYSSVKQVSDFLLSEREIEYTRVVAVEYPRKGIWSLGFVTGESMLDIAAAANEPVVSVLMCTSPMPMTGFTITLPKSECVDLNITIDQAFQYIVSCGVVVPPQQIQNWQGGQLALPQAESATPNEKDQEIEIDATAAEPDSHLGPPNKKVG